jgi:hypothetical protein
MQIFVQQFNLVAEIQWRTEAQLQGASLCGYPVGQKS